MSALFRPVVIWTDDPQLPRQLSAQLPHLVIRVLSSSHAASLADSANAHASALVVIDARSPTTHPTDTRNLAYHLGQLAGRAPGPGSSPGSQHWHLIDRPCRLVAPNQHSVRLSTAEHQLLRCLMAAGPHGVVPREFLEQRIGLRADPDDDDGGEEARYRALNMRISRLRQKARRTGMHLHIEAVAREGYCLSTPVASDPP